MLLRGHDLLWAQRALLDRELHRDHGRPQTLGDLGDLEDLLDLLDLRAPRGLRDLS